MQDHDATVRLMSANPDLLDRAIIVYKRRIWASRELNTAQRQLASNLADDIIFFNETQPQNGQGVVLPVVRSGRGDRDSMQLELSGLWIRLSQGYSPTGQKHMMVPVMCQEDFETARTMPASGKGYIRSDYLKHLRRQHATKLRQEAERQRAA